jgi:hypothetical protein
MNNNHKIKTKISYLILDFNKPQEGLNLLLSIQKFAKHDKEIVYLCNGGESDYAVDFYKKGLVDTLIIKKDGDGGGFGQSDLWRYCKTDYAFFIQVDHVLLREINQSIIDVFINLLDKENYKCIDLNGDQSNRDAWTDRAHFMRTSFFNSLSPFPNGGPGMDSIPWNEEYLGNIFKNNDYQIAHMDLFFGDCGKWSIREAGDGLYKHRCDTKVLYVLKKPTYKTGVYPPFNDKEWNLCLNGDWPENGCIPESWKPHSFRVWSNL